MREKDGRNAANQKLALSPPGRRHATMVIALGWQSRWWTQSGLAKRNRLKV
jgi:hypothetical protein